MCHINIWVSHVLVLALTALSLLFLVPLIVVQLGNFCMNKSTNERFSYRASRARTASVSTERSDSIASSAAQTTTTSMMAEQLVEDLGRAKQHDGFCSTARNCGQFCSDSFKVELLRESKYVGYQTQIYELLRENDQQRHFGMEFYDEDMQRDAREIIIEEDETASSATNSARPKSNTLVLSKQTGLA